VCGGESRRNRERSRATRPPTPRLRWRTPRHPGRADFREDLAHDRSSRVARPTRIRLRNGGETRGSRAACDGPPGAMRPREGARTTTGTSRSVFVDILPCYIRLMFSARLRAASVVTFSNTAGRDRHSAARRKADGSVLWPRWRTPANTSSTTWTSTVRPMCDRPNPNLVLDARPLSLAFRFKPTHALTHRRER
jgi:hypothetical protein